MGDFFKNPWGKENNELTSNDWDNTNDGFDQWFDSLSTNNSVYPNVIYNQVVNQVYKCKYCKEKFTQKQIEAVVSKVETLTKKIKNNIAAVLPYLNTYRKDFNLDTCLRKGHFIAQAMVESNNFNTFEESGCYKSRPQDLLQASAFHKAGVEIDKTTLTSLKSHLTKIFKITDKNKKDLNKTASQIETIILANKVKAKDYLLYGANSTERELKQVKQKVTASDGTQTEEVQYIIYHKVHDCHRVETLSKRYANFSGSSNGDELSRDGYKFKGRGLKQLTHRSNYKRFSKFRTKDKFAKGEPYIDFTAEKNAKSVKEGNYLKLSEPKFATQSAVWYWQVGNSGSSKPYEAADEDNVDKLTRRINGGLNGIKDRRRNTKFVKSESLFNINKHFYEMFVDAKDTGDSVKRKKATDYLKKRTFTYKDKEAQNLLIKINNLSKIKIPKPTIKQGPEIKIEAPNIIIKPFFNKQ